jgi:hypothetical protein
MRNWLFEVEVLYVSRCCSGGDTCTFENDASRAGIGCSGERRSSCRMLSNSSSSCLAAVGPS